MSEFDSLPPLGLAPIEDTQNQGADETSETSPTAASEETVHPENTNESGDSETQDSTVEETPTEEASVFYEEGGKKFSSFDEYRDHVNKQRAAASRIAHERTLEKERADAAIKEAQAYKELLDKALGGKSSNAEPAQEEDQEVKQAVELLRKKGFMTRDEMESLIQERLTPLKQHTDRLQQQQMAEAKAVVDEFINLNPDALDHAESIQRALKAMEDANIPGGIEKAYLLVTNRQPKTKADVVNTEKRETRAVKAAQAGGAPSQVATGKKAKEDDIFGSLITAI